LGFKKAIVPNMQVMQDYGMEIVTVTKVLDAIVAALPRTKFEATDGNGVATQDQPN
jgi:DNA repair protein RadA/Sms